MEKEMSMEVTEENRKEVERFIEEWLNENRTPLPLYEVEIDWGGRTHIECLLVTVSCGGVLYLKFPIHNALGYTVHRIKANGDESSEKANWISFVPHKTS